ncbi:F-box/kelch-repeat protein [Rosa sericea]
MAGKHIPEDIMVDILSRLPVKSLCRFRCVSKRWRSIVSDPQFSKFQFKVASEQKTLSLRLLLYRNAFEIESLDLETPWYGDNHSLRKLTGPFEYREWFGSVDVLGSCNGLVGVATRYTLTCLYIWNPSTGFRHKLPDPATFNAYFSPGEEAAVEVKIFSTRAGVWKSIESPFFKTFLPYFTSAALLEETLHWVCNPRPRNNLWQGPVIYAFDLVKEEFREIPQPTLMPVWLYGFRYRYAPYAAWDSIELWVMRDYGVSDSWTKLFNLKFSNQLEPEYQMLLFPFLATVLVAKLTLNDYRMEIIRIEHVEEPLVTYRLQRRNDIHGMIIYEENLLQVPDYHAVEEYKVKETENPTKLKSRGIYNC